MNTILILIVCTDRLSFMSWLSTKNGTCAMAKFELGPPIGSVGKSLWPPVVDSACRRDDRDGTIDGVGARSIPRVLNAIP